MAQWIKPLCKCEDQSYDAQNPLKAEQPWWPFAFPAQEAEAWNPCSKLDSWTWCISECWVQCRAFIHYFIQYL